MADVKGGLQHDVGTFICRTFTIDANESLDFIACVTIYRDAVLLSDGKRNICRLLGEVEAVAHIVFI